MSRLPHAPLIEVIYELRWPVKELDFKTQYLHGDLYSILKEKYPFRESLFPPNFSMGFPSFPSHRFRKGEKEYPLFQIGPGLITLNIIDEIYEWNDYFKKCKEVTEAFFNVYHADKEDFFYPNLVYIDFFKLDVSKNNVLDFINTNLSVNINQSFHKTESFPNNINVGFKYPVDLGSLNLTLSVGKNGKNEEGIVMETRLNGLKFENKKEEILSWLGSAHDFSSSLFKEMTKGKLYESFK